MAFHWDSPTFGQPGYNIHQDSTGSWTHGDNDSEDN